jgi:O-antigen/teichoic acid export membrane protein
MSAMTAFRGHRLLGSSAFVTAGLAVELGSQFLRMIVLAHMLSAREFGVVASLITVIALVDMSTAIGLDRHLVYAPDGDERHVLDVAHALSMLRGVLLALIVLAMAVPMAMLIGERQSAGSFALLTIVPLARGFAHLGVFQMQRHGTFWRSAIPEGIGALLGLAATVIAAAIAPDHRAILWGLCVQAISFAVFCHLLADGRGFRISFDGVAIRAALRFCLPLAANGFALAISYQLDRLIVGAYLGVVALGVYTLTLTLFLQPMSLLLRLVTTMMQPYLSSAWHSDPNGRFPRLARWMISWSGLVGLACAVPGICMGFLAWHLLFGTKFAVEELTFVLLSTLLMVRSVRHCMHLLGLAIGSTRELMIANLAGCLGTPVTMIALFLHPAVVSAVIGLLVADVLSIGVVAWLLQPRLHFINRRMLYEMIGIAVIPAVLAAWVLVVRPDVDWRIAAILLTCGLGFMRVMKLHRPRA